MFVIKREGKGFAVYTGHKHLETFSTLEAANEAINSGRFDTTETHISRFNPKIFNHKLMGKTYVPESDDRGLDATIRGQSSKRIDGTAARVNSRRRVGRNKTQTKPS